jgi:hypothetical protein
MDGRREAVTGPDHEGENSQLVGFLPQEYGSPILLTTVNRYSIALATQPYMNILPMTYLTSPTQHVIH